MHGALLVYQANFVRCRVVMSGLYQVYQVSCCYVGIVSGVSGVMLLCRGCIRCIRYRVVMSGLYQVYQVLCCYVGVVSDDGRTNFCIGLILSTARPLRF